MSYFEKKLKRRQGKFKKKSTPSNSRDKRVEHTIKLSKNKRDERLMKRRNLGKSGQRIRTSNSNKEITNYVPTLDELPTLVENVKSNDLETVHKSTQLIRKMISVEEDPPVYAVLQTRIIPTFVEFLQKEDDPFLQFESSWIISNICSGNHDECEYVVDLGIVPIFNQLLHIEDPDILEQSCWALGNISGDCVEYRDLILGQNRIIDNLINVIQNPFSNLDIIQNANWCLSNLCRGKPRPPFNKVKKAIPVFANLIKKNEKQLRIDSTWGLSYLSSGDDLNINSVIEAGIIPRMVQFLNFKSPKIQTPALRVLGNIVTGNFEQTEKVLETDVLEKLIPLIGHHRDQIKRESCWVLSNITAGRQNQIQKVINSGIIPKLVDMMQNCNKVIKQEACWVLSNGVYGGNIQQIVYFVEQNCLKEFIYFLKYNGTRILKICLEAIERILQVGEIQAELTGEQNPVVQMIENLNGTEGIEKLIEHENKVIYKLAGKIWDEYLDQEESSSSDDDDDDHDDHDDHDEDDDENSDENQYDNGNNDSNYLQDNDQEQQLGVNNNLYEF
ncbi:importin alpha [Anaeramoeba flamelloides]|uniref:Importin subunit alpha n=1 Tax=Anaeramoeba flamelloides TaxID=1746091 RepID=A0AAV7YM60_9EUKA|nr:importin alpha [Anaeramoeba flamelloides]